jgi:hypothetical protein
LRRKLWRQPTSGPTDNSLQRTLRCSTLPSSLYLAKKSEFSDSGVFCAILVSHAIMGSLATKVIARLQHFYVFLNIACVESEINCP